MNIILVALDAAGLAASASECDLHPTAFVLGLIGVAAAAAWLLTHRDSY